MAHRIIALVIVAVIAAQAHAQPAPPPVLVLKHVLALSDEQIAALQQLLEARQAAIEPLQRQIAQHQEHFRKGFEELLTPEQRTRLEAIRGVEAAIHAAEALRFFGL